MSRESVENTVRDVIMSILPSISPSDIRGDLHTRELGADSVDRVEIIFTVLQELGLQMPLASFAQLKDINALVDCLTAAMARDAANAA
jgi:polyketide biosynthesis acyl carrier protein